MTNTPTNYDKFKPVEDELGSIEKRSDALSDLVHETFVDYKRAANNNNNYGPLGEQLYSKLSEYATKEILGLENGIQEGNEKYKTRAAKLVDQITGVSKDQLVKTLEGKTELHHSDLEGIIRAVKQGIAKDAQTSVMESLNDVRELKELTGYAVSLAGRAGVTSLTAEKLLTKNAARSAILEMLMLLEQKKQYDNAAKDYKLRDQGEDLAA